MLKILEMLHSCSFYMDCFKEIYSSLSNQNQMHSQNLYSLPIQNQASTYMDSKPIFLTKSNAFFIESKLSTSLMTLSTSLIVYSHWHKAFGHIDMFADNKSFYKDSEILPNFIKYNCQPCLLFKSIYYVPRPSLTKATKPLEGIFLDLSRKAPILLLGRSFYYITFIDNFSRFAWIYFLKEKLQAVAAIKDFINMVENQTSYII